MLGFGTFGNVYLAFKFIIIHYILEDQILNYFFYFNQNINSSLTGEVMAMSNKIIFIIKILKFNYFILKIFRIGFDIRIKWGIII